MLLLSDIKCKDKIYCFYLKKNVFLQMNLEYETDSTISYFFFLDEFNGIGHFFGPFPSKTARWEKSTVI